jgi:hypothetical protein
MSLRETKPRKQGKKRATVIAMSGAKKQSAKVELPKESPSLRIASPDKKHRDRKDRKKGETLNSCPPSCTLSASRTALYGIGGKRPYGKMIL